MAQKQVRLGQEAFVVVTTDGRVERTMVGAIGPYGYEFLNGCSSGRGHWFDFDEARDEAVNKLKAHESRLRQELRALAKRWKFLQSDEYRSEVMNSSLKVVDLNPGERRGRTRRLKSVTVPGDYLLPGASVYVVITPKTKASEHREVYRPYPHFVLETKVQQVYFEADGTAHYSFTTPFEVEEYFTLKHKAVRCLESFSELGTLESIPYVSHDEERQKIDEIEDIPF
jgi:hypothetical protein